MKTVRFGCWPWRWRSRAAEEKSTEHKTFSGVRELIIDNITGFIEVTASTGSSVEMDIEKTLRARSQDRLDMARKEISLAPKQEGGLVQLLVDGPFRCHCCDNSINFHGRPGLRFQLRLQSSGAARPVPGTADGERLAHPGRRHGGRLQDQQCERTDRDEGCGRVGIGAHGERRSEGDVRAESESGDVVQDR